MRGILKPIQLNNLRIDFPVALGPMAGVTDAPFRALCKEQGCGLLYTEMVSAKALHFGSAHTESLLKRSEAESPLGVQLFGSEPDIIAEAAMALQEHFDFIDFNMGCPVPKVVKNREGSYLLTEPQLVGEILTKLVKSVHIPVTVKMRKSFRAGDNIAVNIAKIAAEAGVSMLAVHGRSREQYYSGKADWDAIRLIKEAVSIPVFGNGDIRTPQDAEEKIRESGVDGILIGRGAEGNPWIFREMKAYLENGETAKRPAMDQIVAMILRHAKLLEEEKGTYIAIREMRHHASCYLAGAPRATKIRVALNSVNTIPELEELLYREVIGKR